MSGFEPGNWGDDSRLDVVPNRPSRVDEDGVEYACSLTVPNMVVLSEADSIGERRSERTLDGGALGFGFRVSDGDEMRERYPVFRPTSSASVCRLSDDSVGPTDCPWDRTARSCSIPYGVFAVDELGPEGFSGMVEADPLGIVRSPIRC